MSKGYTISYFVKAISKASNGELKNSVYSVVAPRGGFNTVKAHALDAWLGGPGFAARVAKGTGRFAGFGNSARTRLLKALRLRKKNGSL
jgi:hypothetical protein